MLQHFYNDDATKGGFIGGTGLVFLCHIGVDDLVQTVVLSCVGAVVSVGVSLLLKYVIRRWKR